LPAIVANFLFAGWYSFYVVQCDEQEFSVFVMFSVFEVRRHHDPQQAKI
jgi:hypothetical protein